MAEQASDERTMEDLELHLRKAVSHLNVSALKHLTNEGREKVLNMAHNRVVKAYNTFQYLRETQ